MVPRIRSGFALEVFDKKTARSSSLADYLLIYVQDLTPQHRTKTNELVEFLANPVPGQIIYYFGLSYRGKPCGFATLMFYPEFQVGIIDHIAIRATARGYGAFFSFCELIADHLERARQTYNYLVAEIVLNDQPITTGMNALTLIRLTRFIGFRIANIPYYAPDTLIVANRERCRAALMLLCQPDRTEIDQVELTRILDVIFFKHYGEWHRRTMNTQEFGDYERAARTAYDGLMEAIKKQKIIKVNGMKNFDLPYVVEPFTRPKIGLVGALILIAIPAALTIALAIAQETRLTVIVLIFMSAVFALLLIPRLRKPILRFFQLE